MKLVGGWNFYIIKLYYFGKILKCIELNGTSRKEKCIEIKGTERVVCKKGRISNPQTDLVVDKNQ